MKKLLYLLFIPLLTLVQSCTTKKYTATELPEERLVFGSGGGFSGKITEYTLLKNGQVFTKGGANTALQELEPLTKKEAKGFFKELPGLALTDLKLDKPGNMYYFLKVGEAERITWGHPEHPVADNIDKFYRSLIRTVKNKKLKPVTE